MMREKIAIEQEKARRMKAAVAERAASVREAAREGAASVKQAVLNTGKAETGIDGGDDQCAMGKDGGGARETAAPLGGAMSAAALRGALPRGLLSLHSNLHFPKFA